MKISRAFASFAFVLALCIVAGCSKGTYVKGRVVNARTGAPVSGAEVVVRFQKFDGRGNWVDSAKAEITTAASGEFVAHAPHLGGRFTAFARRDGFYPNYDNTSARQLSRHLASTDQLVQIDLCPVESPQPLPRGQGEVRSLGPGQRMGWNFAAARPVAEAMADFICERDETGGKIAFLVARGRGGFFRIAGLPGEWALFNMPLAPNDGYSERVDIREVKEGERAVYYVRTADGNHYGKIDVIGPVKAREYVGVQFYWVYQPSGSNALEIPLDQAAR
ncbi:carboxypeptidase regulatory-like domain-containing protein [Candidatus Sumerlaeota bacterium]|nr:carboxypeptidase regulatory-like domain-containing protein [Candidatus Sumerlaeota bacterium]